MLRALHAAVFGDDQSAAADRPPPYSMAISGIAGGASYAETRGLPTWDEFGDLLRIYDSLRHACRGLVARHDSRSTHWICDSPAHVVIDGEPKDLHDTAIHLGRCRFPSLADQRRACGHLEPLDGRSIMAQPYKITWRVYGKYHHAPLSDCVLYVEYVSNVDQLPARAAELQACMPPFRTGCAICISYEVRAVGPRRWR